MRNSKQKIPSPPCVVVDTNVWYSNLLLRSSLGPSLLYSLNRASGALGLPEVIESEIRKQLLGVGLQAAGRIQQSFREISAIMGSHSPYTVPTSDQIAAAIESRLVELDPLVVRVPLKLKHARAALERVNLNLPPNAPGDQQFKDSLIWEAVLELARRRPVHFVTKDNGFYEGRKPDRGMAAVLIEECNTRKVEVHIYRELDTCLSALRDVVPDLDYAQIARAVLEAIKPDLAIDGVKHRVGIGEIQTHKISAFLTENHDSLGVSFEITLEGQELASFNELQLAPHPDHPRSNIRITAIGNCSYSITSGKVLDARVEKIEYRWKDNNGEEQYRGSVFAFASTLYLGREPDVPYRFRRPIEEGESAAD